MKRLLSSVAVLGAAIAGLSAAMPAGAADQPRAVVELFTSQGCSSCPPADALIGDLARSGDLLVLTMPVDYWDYLGWKDTLADPAFTARQRAYARARGDGQVYTPQVVINGSVHAVGSNRAAIEKAAVTTRSQPGVLSVPVSLGEAAGKVVVRVDTATNAPANAPRAGAVWLATVARSRAVAIGRGENTGRSVTYTNVVRDMVKLGEWTGAPMTVDVPVGVARPDGTDGYVVLVQAADSSSRPGAILGAAKGPGL